MLLPLDRDDAPLSAAPPEASVPIETVFQRAEGLIKRRRTLGEHAIRVIIDHGGPFEVREQAARDLGTIRYRPAIAPLVEKLDDINAARVALRQFRTAHLGKVVSAILRITDFNGAPLGLGWTFCLTELNPYSSQCARGFLLESGQSQASRSWANRLLNNACFAFGEAPL